MSIFDLNKSEIDDCLQKIGPVDFVIIGAGPVGITIAQELSRSRRRILVIESGGLEPTSETTDLDEFESIGAPRVPSIELPRVRALGGTSTVWSGRCAPFDEIDFEMRPWVEHSGWPITCGDINPFLERAGRHLGLLSSSYDESLWEQIRYNAFPGFDQQHVRSQFWQYSQDTFQRRDFARLGPQFVRDQAADTKLLLNATVTRLIVAKGRLTSIEVGAPGGKRGIVSASCAVLCAGGIENARLLLLSERQGLGHWPASTVVGRFLMDHPRCTIGFFDPPDVAVIENVLGLYRLRLDGGRRWFTHGVALPAAVQRQKRLLNCSAWIAEERAHDDPWGALKRFLDNRKLTIAELRAVLANSQYVTSGFWRRIRSRGVLHKCDLLNIDCFVEQVPDPHSRLTLAEKRDRFGLPLARLDWKIGDLERRTVWHFANSIISELKRLGLPMPHVSDWIAKRDFDRASFNDAAHPSGTTRMSKDPTAGVVDEHCRVHNLDGLYVAGSSVFPTIGQANPTLMAVALAVRLADHLMGRFDNTPLRN